MNVYSHMFQEAKARNCEAITAALDFGNKNEDKKDQQASQPAIHKRGVSGRFSKQVANKWQADFQGKEKTHKPRKYVVCEHVCW